MNDGKPRGRGDWSRKVRDPERVTTRRRDATEALPEIEWRSPPLPAPAVRHPVIRWVRRLAPLMLPENLMRWAMIRRLSTDKQAIRMAAELRGLRFEIPPGRWEFVARGHEVFARFHGGPASSMSEPSEKPWVANFEDHCFLECGLPLSEHTPERADDGGCPGKSQPELDGNAIKQSNALKDLF